MKPTGDSSEDLIEVHLTKDDVQVTLEDDDGNPLPVNDVDLQLKLPSKFKHTTFKGKFRQLLNKFKKEDIIYTIKERVTLTDSSTGQSFEVEMNLKVQIPAKKVAVKKSKSLPFVESLKKSVICPIMPWRCRQNSSKEELDQEVISKNVEQKVITKSPAQRAISFDDIATATKVGNNNILESSPSPTKSES